MPMLSPRTQQAAGPGAGSSPEQEKALFEQGFSEMAYNIILGKFPDIANDIVTFKLLKSEPERGSALGVFVLVKGQQTVYIPVVLADNQVKPLDLMYYKEMNVFLPLSTEWLQELDKLQTQDMGSGVTAPKTLTTDVDIRGTVVPPTTGRYSYAADKEAAVRDAFQAFAQAKVQSKSAAPVLPEFLAALPNNAKTAMLKFFETHPRLMQKAAHFHGVDALVSSLKHTQVKQADYGARISRQGSLYVADKDTPVDAYREVFGPKAPLAFKGVALKGYFAKDDRKFLNRAVSVQPYTHLQEPREPGAYKIWTRMGEKVHALVINNPVDLDDPTRSSRVMPRNIRFRRDADAPAEPYMKREGPYRIPSRSGPDEGGFVEEFVGVTEDGKIFLTRHLIGEPTSLEKLLKRGTFSALMSKRVTKIPSAGQTGLFVRRIGASWQATTPVTILKVSDRNGAKYIDVETTGFHRKTLVIDAQSPISAVVATKESPLVYLPRDYVFLSGDDQDMYRGERDFLTDPREIFKLAKTQLAADYKGSPFTVKKAEYSGWTFGNGAKVAYGFKDALVKLATDAHIDVDTADSILKTAEKEGSVEFWAVAAHNYVKLAAVEPPPGGDAPPGGDPMDQMMAQVQQQQMVQGPPQPSPLDMAVAEQMQNITQQQAALQQQAQMLQMVQMRAQQISGTGGAAGNPAAAATAMAGPMDPSMMGAGAPTQMGQPPMGGAPGMGQPPMGQPPMGQPPMGGAPGMDPMQQQAQQQPPPPPAAMMAADAMSPDAIAQQVNPQFADQAGELNDAGIFDAAAVGSLASVPSLRDMVSLYLPNIEKALDNLGRVLLTLWMDEVELKESVGIDAYIKLEDNLRETFKGLGTLVLSINKTALAGQTGSQ